MGGKREKERTDPGSEKRTKLRVDAASARGWRRRRRRDVVASGVHVAYAAAMARASLRFL